MNESEDEEEPIAVAAPVRGKSVIPAPIASTPNVAQKTMASGILSPISPPKQQCFSLADGHPPSGVTFAVHDPIGKKKR